MLGGKILRGGTAALNDKNMSLDTLKKGNTPAPVHEIEQLHAQMQDMQMEIDILKKPSMS